jgi:hypothetical protein
MNFERETKNKLPIVLIRIVNEYLQDRWKKKFNLVMKQILDTMKISINTALIPKKKHQFIFGKHLYRLVYQKNIYGKEDIRVGTLTSQYEGYNSMLLSPYKILLLFRVFYYEHLRSYDEYGNSIGWWNNKEDMEEDRMGDVNYFDNVNEEIRTMLSWI